MERISIQDRAEPVGDGEEPPGGAMGATAVDLGAKVDLELIHEFLMDTVRTNGRIGLQDLVVSVSRQSRATAGEVTAAVWDLVQDNRLRYGADGYVSLPRD